MELRMAKSLAGHDKGELYVVLGEDGHDVVLVNGRNRTMEAPKRKRRRQVQLVTHFPTELVRTAAAAERWTDESVRKVIRRYHTLQAQYGGK